MYVEFIFFCHQKAINFIECVDSRVNNFLRCERRKCARYVRVWLTFMSLPFFFFLFSSFQSPCEATTYYVFVFFVVVVVVGFFSLSFFFFSSRPYGLLFSQYNMQCSTQPILSYHIALERINKRNFYSVFTIASTCNQEGDGVKK